MARYWVGGTGTWSGVNTANWAASSGGAGGETVPTSTDDVFLDGNSGGGAITTSGGRPCKNFDCTGFTGSLTLDGDLNVNGNGILGSTMTLPSAGGTFSMNATGSITSNGVSMGCGIAILPISGTVTLVDALVTTKAITLYNGTFNASNQNITCSAFDSNNSDTRTLTMGSGTWTLTGGTGNVWDTSTTTNLTFNANTSTIKLTGAGNSVFRGGGLTFYNYWNAKDAGVTNTIIGSNTFNDLKVTSALLQQFGSGETQTITSLTAVGTAGNIIQLWSAGLSAATLSKSSGTVTVDYCDLKYLTGSGGATWNATHSVDSGNNIGWNFHFIDVNDNISVAENITFQQLSLTTNDVITTAESIAITIPVSIPNIYDNVSIVESSDVKVLVNPSVVETVSITENSTVNIEGAFVNTNDTIVVDESTVLQFIASPTVIDTVTLSEDINVNSVNTIHAPSSDGDLVRRLFII